jgi:hypothetical protein
MRLISKTLLVKLMYLHVIPFKVVFIRRYTLLHMILLGLEVSSDVILWECFKYTVFFLWMPSVDWKWVLLTFDRTFQFWEKKTFCCARAGEYRACWSIGIWFFQLKTGWPKLLCAPLCFVTAKANRDFTEMIFLKISFVIL